jgi:hypothetical protein
MLGEKKVLDTFQHVLPLLQKFFAIKLPYKTGVSYGQIKTALSCGQKTNISHAFISVFRIHWTSLGHV